MDSPGVQGKFGALRPCQKQPVQATFTHSSQLSVAMDPGHGRRWSAEPAPVWAVAPTESRGMGRTGSCSAGGLESRVIERELGWVLPLPGLFSDLLFG